MSEVWTIKAALEWCRGYLERKGDDNPRLSAEWLLAEATDLRRVELYVNFDRPLSLEERDVLRGYVARRGAGEPLQYITGEVAFRHIAVKVRPGVLIPRPETEVLVSEALSLLPAPQRRHATDSVLTEDEARELLLKEAVQKAVEEGLGGDGDAAVANVSNDAEGHAATEKAEADSGPSSGDAPAAGIAPLYVADICTGSGCIACSVAYEHPDTRVIAADIAPEALALARENAGAGFVGARLRVEKRSGRRCARTLHGQARSGGFQPALHPFGRHGRPPARGGGVRASARARRRLGRPRSVPPAHVVGGARA